MNNLSNTLSNTSSNRDRLLVNTRDLTGPIKKCVNFGGSIGVRLIPTKDEVKHFKTYQSIQ